MPPAEVVPVTPAVLGDWPLPAPDDGGDKHTRGTVLVVGGAVSTPGAVLLAGLAALRVGAGRPRVATAPRLQVPLGVALPEAGTLGLAAGEDGELDARCADQLVQAANAGDTVVPGPGLAISGSGDVPVGLVGGLLALGAEPDQAAVWGQHIHAAAGDRLAGRLGRLGFLAGELLDEVPRVLSGLAP